MIALLQASAGTGAIIAQVLPILAIGLVFYFIVIAPANKQRKKTQEMMETEPVMTQGFVHDWIYVPLWRVAWADHDELRALDRLAAHD